MLNDIINKKGNIIKNDIDLTNNIIITGINASGKTTMIKTSAINIILTQQYGIGFYDKCSITPYTHIHSYININDTSDRNSLFQHEAQRCKDMINIINNTNNKKTNHLCIFDELFSGTNVYDSTLASIAFIRYLSYKQNISFILTTHLLSMCNKIERFNKKKYKSKKKVKNYKMSAYKYTPGISNEHGGLTILRDMKYSTSFMNLCTYK